jgi:hypothetical protein
MTPSFLLITPTLPGLNCSHHFSLLVWVSCRVSRRFSFLLTLGGRRTCLDSTCAISRTALLDSRLGMYGVGVQYDQVLRIQVDELRLQQTSMLKGVSWS